ncbi:hypothetical protein B0G62_10439 [Paraburkholderia eburnea]|uniref:Uncharacterized protein n=1 Tax=Paraburkholderia eburnea TaxID=1189126 RepID=A0A2S4MDD2_9BURK|nr:hypothetical protein [Paraburkholderia eburnea]POR52742.1 hypothetical protein B0G62_10439 [Paraburkholderia eburnea]PRZ23610.1 hypothetical protein BX588_10439 [Paraburkholderia eburnea]
MTNGQRLKLFWHRIDVFVLSTLVVLLAMAAGAGVMNWLNQRERMQLVDRFPAVRAEERAACVHEFQGRIDDLTQLNERSAQALADLRSLIKDTHDVAQYTLRFLGDRARISDQHTTAVLQQARQAAQAATAAQQTSAQVERKVAVAAAKADEAASTAQAVSQKLDTATRPALPGRPWAGGH